MVFTAVLPKDSTPKQSIELLDQGMGFVADIIRNTHVRHHATVCADTPDATRIEWFFNVPNLGLRKQLCNRDKRFSFASLDTAEKAIREDRKITAPVTPLEEPEAEAPAKRGPGKGGYYTGPTGRPSDKKAKA
jgi:hypothetical protein